MAQIPAEIMLRVRAEQAYKEIQKLEREIGRIDAAEGKIPDAITRKYVKLNGVLRQREKEVRDAGFAEKVNTRELKKQTAELAKQQRARRNRRQNALLGGGFPLLFGAGPGQAIAGLAGGAVGGFAGGIAAQAALAAISGLNDAIVETAAVTASTAGSFEFLAENQLYSSDETRRLADELAELGRVEELAALNTKELVNLIGNQGVENLQALDSEWRELLSNVAELGLAIAAFISQYLEPVIALLNSAVGSINTRNRFESLRGDVAGTELGTQLEQAIREARQENGRGARLGSLQTSDMEALLQRFAPLREVTAQVPVTDQDRRDFKPPKNSAADDLERQVKAGEKLARQFRQRVELLNAESDLAEKLIRIDQKREEIAVRIRETAAASQQAELLQENAKLRELERAKALEEFGKKSVESADKFLEKLKLQEQAETRKKELIEQGILPNLAEELVKLEQQAEKLKQNLDLDIATLDAIKAEVEARGGNVEAIEKEIDALKRKKKEIEGAEGKAKQEAEKDSSFGGRLEAEVDKQQQKLNELIDPANQVVGAANAIGDAFRDAFNEVLTGSKSAQEAFADMAKKIGAYFIDMAAQMIAEYIKLILMQTILNAIGGPQMGGGGGANAGPGGYTVPGAAVPKTSTGTFAGAFKANGGPVDSATPYIVGERGPEVFVPNTSGQIVSNEQSRAQLNMYSPGNAVDAPAGPMNVNMSYSGPVMSFDDSRYVPVAAIPDIIKDAAKQGEQRTLASMRNKVSTRNRVGI